MDIKKYMKVVPAVAALLLAFACNHDELEPVEDTQARIIPFTVSARSNIGTRATLDEYNKYNFETGDKLYVWGENISGELMLQGVSAAGEATFSGNLTWTGSGDPADDLELNAVLVGPNDRLIGNFSSFIGSVYALDYAPDYLSAGFASSYAEAVESFSYLRTESTYGAKSFNFYGRQSSAFVSFVITLEDGTAGNTNIDVSISNNGGAISKGNVMTSKENGVVTASFIAPVLGYTTLNGAAVQLGKRDVINFGGDNTLYGNGLFKVSKTYTRYSITASATIPSLGEKSKTSTNKPMGYTTKLSELLEGLGASSMSSMVTECTRKSGSSVNVTPVGDPATDYEFTVVGEGPSVFNMKTSFVTVPVTITVAKMTPPES